MAVDHICVAEALVEGDQTDYRYSDIFHAVVVVEDVVAGEVVNAHASVVDEVVHPLVTQYANEDVRNNTLSEVLAVVLPDDVEVADRKDFHV